MGTSLVPLIPLLRTDSEQAALIRHYGGLIANWRLSSGHPDTIAKERGDLRLYARRVFELVADYLGPDPADKKPRRKRRKVKTAKRKRR